METTIIMLAYNEEQYIHRAINSLKNQTDTKFKLYFVDDGSTDNTLNIACEALKKSTFYFTIMSYSKNHGVIYCLDKVFAMIPDNSNIIRLDGDDELTPQAIEILKSNYQTGRIVTGQYKEISYNGNEIIINPNTIYDCVACGVLMNKLDILQSGGISSDNVGMFIEYDLYARLIKNGCKPYIVNNLIYIYHRHNNSTTSNLKSVNDSINMLERKWGRLRIRKY